MGFVQIIEFTASRMDEVKALDQEWMAATEGKRTGSPSRILTRRPSRGPRGPTPTAVRSSSPRAWAAPATADSQPAGEPTNACSTLATGSDSST